MRRTIIIADDSEIDRKVLKQQLKDDYEVLEAADGEQLMSVLATEWKRISAILLDIIMPVMDGFAVLERVRAKAEYAGIPVILVTIDNEVETKKKAVRYGANGYFTKPYDMFLIKKSLENTITFRENAALVNTLSKDKLTGMISSELFFEECNRLIQKHEPGHYIISCIDIDQFKVINDQYGMQVGDEVLKHVADCINLCYKDLNGLACRFSADKFAVLYPSVLANTSVILDNHRVATNPPCINHPIRIRIGRYVVKDLSLQANIMFERATVAEESIKGRYDVYIAEYNDDMRNHILREQQIVNDMVKALENGEFIPFLQPQYNHATNALIGAEALVRWKKGDTFISPGEFIPIFEKNGFIYEMDKRIWEDVCMLLRRWLDEDRHPLPVSVNISRRDLYRDDFYEVICGLVEQYRLPVDLLRLEVTESAFADSPQHVIHMVNQLIHHGFTVEIDDFGSGYSSLNTLKDVQASILKLDMKFFSETEYSERSGNIIESVVRMAKWLGMAVIAEGVEKEEHADYLKSIGCYYIQGFLYARPMPVADYEALLGDNDHERRLTRLKTVTTLDNSQFWNPTSLETLIFNSYVGGACILEQYRGKLDLLRVNNRYLKEIGSLISGEVNFVNLNPTNYLDQKNLELLNQTLLAAAETKKETYCELHIENVRNETEYIRYNIRMIACTQDRSLFYCVILNLTEQRVAERELAEEKEWRKNHAKKLISVQDMLPIALSTMMAESADIAFIKDTNRRYIACSKPAAESLGFRNVCDILGKTDYDLFSEEVAKQFEAEDAKIYERGEAIVGYVMEMKVRGKDYVLNTSKYPLLDNEGNVVGMYSVCIDITKSKKAEERLRIL